MSSHRVHVGWILLVVMVTTVAAAGPVSANPTAGNSTGTATVQDDTQTTFAVTQGNECYQVTPEGHAWEDVSAFYDFNGRNSEGTGEFQDNQVSNLIFFHGTQGYSLVVLHDKYEDFGEASYGGTATMEFLGLPESGEWVIEDDSYEGRDDEFNHRGTRSKITWKWIGGRSDGAVFRGLDTTENLDLTINPGFNENSEGWEEWDWSGDENNRTQAWRLYTGNGSSVNLDMNEEIRVTKGKCDSASPTAALSASSTTIGINESVTLDASEATDDTGIVEYQWDLNSDGTVDRTSTEPTISQRFGAAGTYNVTVTVSDNYGKVDSSSLGITVENESDSADGSGSANDGSNAADTDTSSSGGPGMGLLAGFAALLLSIGLLLRRR